MIKRIAAIDIGSSAIRMLISEIDDQTSKITTLEELRVHISIGIDIFDKAKIELDTTMEVVRVLKRYKRLCDEYKVEKIVAVATTVLKDATNVDLFLDKIYYDVGIKVNLLTVSREIEYIYKALKYNDKYQDEDCKYKGIIEVGSGSVDVIIFNKDAIVFFRSFPIGALKMKQIFDNATNIDENFSNYLKVTIEHELISIKREIPASKIGVLFGIGAELEILFDILNNKNEKNGNVDRGAIQKFVAEIQDLTDEELVHKYDVTYDYMDTFKTKCFIFTKVIDFFDCDKVYIPKVSLRDGMIYEETMEVNESVYKHNRLQLKINCINIGRKMNYDEKHALRVTNLAMKIFDETKNLHHLGDDEKLYLMCAAILHDVGMSLSASSHHKHSLYIIKSQTFFYFDDIERDIVANVARYHRRSIPKENHPDYMILPDEKKVLVKKLASILRIADSLDNTHLQLIDDISVHCVEGENPAVIITAYSNANLFAERYSFKYKRDLFEFIFGVKPKLRVRMK